MKLIKFDLPLNGAKIRNLEELRDNFTTEILELHTSGLLLKWLKSRNLMAEADKLPAIPADHGDVDKLVALYEIFGVVADRQEIEAALLSNQQLLKDQKDQEDQKAREEQKELKLQRELEATILTLKDETKVVTDVEIATLSGNAGSEVASRLFGYFLTWMQEKTSPVFVLATANDISALPPELLRKGRFDEIFYVDFPNETERAAIFNVHLERRKKSSTKIDRKILAAKTDGFSGADIESVVKEAIEKSFVDGKVQLNTDRLLEVIRETQPLSVVMEDRVKEYKEKFSQTKIKPAS